MSRRAVPLAVVAVLGAVDSADSAAGGDPKQGSQVFRACLACHSLEPGKHRTGPSLAGVFGRKAGTATGFRRYSEALRSAKLVWREDTLDAFLADPRGFLPGNRMTFRGVDDAQARTDLIAYLEVASADAGGSQPDSDEGGMMAAPGDLEDLKGLGPDQQVKAIRYCGDTYTVAVESGESPPFWEFNLRFKTDSSDKGPEPGHPVLIPASMMGDRAFVIFAAPEEISRFIQSKC